MNCEICIKSILFCQRIVIVGVAVTVNVNVKLVEGDRGGLWSPAENLTQ